MRRAMFILSAVLVTVWGYPAAAATAFLKLDGIKGESQEMAHKEEIELASFQLSANSVVVVKKIDIASPKLFWNAAAGDHIKTAVISQADDSRKYTLSDVLVSNLRQQAGPASREEVTFTFSRIEMATPGTKEGLTAARTTRAPGTRAPIPAGQRLEIFMKVPGVPGDAAQAQHLGENVASSVSWTLRNAGGGKADFRPFEVQKALDSGSDKLMTFSTAGQHIQTVTMTLVNGGRDFYIYRLSDVIVSGYSRGSSSESFRLQYSRIEVEIKATSTGGALQTPQKFGYDLTANKKV